MAMMIKKNYSLFYPDAFKTESMVTAQVFWLVGFFIIMVKAYAATY